MARVDQRLRIGDRWANECTLSESYIHDVDPAGIRRWIYPPYRLVQQVEAETEEGGQGVVRREPFRRLIFVVYIALEGHWSTEKYRVADPTEPWCKLKQLLSFTIRIPIFLEE